MAQHNEAPDSHPSSSPVLSSRKSLVQARIDGWVSGDGQAMHADRRKCARLLGVASPTLSTAGVALQLALRHGAGKCSGMFPSDANSSVAEPATAPGTRPHPGPRGHVGTAATSQERDAGLVRCGNSMDMPAAHTKMPLCEDLVTALAASSLDARLAAHLVADSMTDE